MIEIRLTNQVWVKAVEGPGSFKIINEGYSVVLLREGPVSTLPQNGESGISLTTKQHPYAEAFVVLPVGTQLYAKEPSDSDARIIVQVAQ